MTSLVAAALLAACGGESRDADLVGTWDGSRSLTFRADGTFDGLGDTGVHLHGTWATNEGLLTLAGNLEPPSFTYGYAVDGDALMLDAYVPDGATDGVVGTWRGEVTVEQTTDTTIDLRADGTGHITEVVDAPIGQSDADVMWQLIGPELRLELTYSDGSSAVRTMSVIPDVAIGDTLLARTDPAP